MTWDCPAYGLEGKTVGALCFFSAELGSRVCGTQDECHARLDVERRRVFNRIHDLAAAGNPTAEYLAGEFTDPERLLGGGQRATDETDRKGET